MCQALSCQEFDPMRILSSDEEGVQMMQKVDNELYSKKIRGCHLSQVKSARVWNRRALSDSGACRH